MKYYLIFMAGFIAGWLICCLMSVDKLQDKK